MDITERLQLIVDKLFGGNKASFARTIGLAPTSISNYLSKERASKPSSEILEKIINSLENVNALWLLTGKGEMLKVSPEGNAGNNVSGNFTGGTFVGYNSGKVEANRTQIPQKNVDQKKDYDLQHRIEILTKDLEAKDNLLKERERIIEEKERIIEEKERFIKVLLDKR